MSADSPPTLQRKLTAAEFLELLKNGEPALIQDDFIAIGLTIGGDFDLRGARIEGRLDLQRSQFGDNLYVCAGAGAPHVQDDFWAMGLEVNGDVDLTGLQAGKRLILQGSSIGGSLYLGDHEPGNDASFTANPETVICDALMLNDTVISNVVQLIKVKLRGRLDLEGARVKDFKLISKLPRETELRGFEFQLIEIKEPSESPDGQRVPDEDSFRQWLRSDPSFNRSSYTRLEKWLRERFREKEADTVFVERKRRERERMPWLSNWPFQVFLDVTMAYGTAIGRLGTFLVLAFVFTCYTFTYAQSVSKENANSNVALSWTKLDAALLSLGVVFPMILDAEVDGWRPSVAQVMVFQSYTASGNVVDYTLTVRYDQYARLLAFACWFLVPYWLLGLTGLIRKHQ